MYLLTKIHKITEATRYDYLTCKTWNINSKKYTT